MACGCSDTWLVDFFCFQTGMTKQEVEKIEQSVAEEERLLYEQSDLHVEVVELTRLAAIKVRLFGPYLK